jgi:hypothetical protein
MYGVFNSIFSVHLHGMVLRHRDSFTVTFLYQNVVALSVNLKLCSHSDKEFSLAVPAIGAFPSDMILDWKFISLHSLKASFHSLSLKVLHIFL